MSINGSAPQVLLVDANARNLELLSSFLGEAGYHTLIAGTLAALDALVSDDGVLERVSLAMVDLQGFESGIWDRCRTLHEARVPFIVIARPNTMEAHLEVRRRSHGAGARHTLTKPLRKEQLLTLVRILTETDD